MTEAEIIDRAKSKYVLITEWEKEERKHKDEAKSFRERITSAEAEIRALINGATNQGELGLDETETLTQEEPACIEGKEHDWEDVIEIVPDFESQVCNQCDMERRRESESDPWSYVYRKLATPEPEPVQ